MRISRLWASARLGLRRLDDRSASPMLVGALTGVLMLSILAAGAGWLGDALQQARMSQRDLTSTHEYDATVNLLEKVQVERGRGEIFAGTGSSEDLQRFRESTRATDAALDRLGEEGATAEANRPDIPGRLSVIRAAVGQEATFELYSDVVALMGEALAMNTASAEGSPGVAARRARDSLIAAAEVLAKRRGLVAGIAARGDALAEDAEVRLQLLEGDVETLLSNAATLSLGTDVVGRILQLREELPSRESVVRADDLIEDLRDHDALLSWYDSATGDVHAVFALVGELNAIERVRASTAHAEATRSIRVNSLALFSLSVLVLTVGAVGVKATRERNAALVEHEELASSVSRWFLPAGLGEVEGLRVDAAYAPSSDHVQAGGDWYDVFQLSTGVVVIGIGDVAGHGPEAVAHMSTLRNMMRGLIMTGGPDLRDALGYLDRVAGAIGITATLLYCAWDPRSKQLDYTRAGHPAGVLVDPGDGTALLWGGSDPLIGLVETPSREVFSLDVPTGSTLVLYTDGIVESRDTPMDESIDSVAEFIRSRSDTSSLASDLVGRRPDDHDDGAVLVVDFGPTASTGALPQG